MAKNFNLRNITPHPNPPTAPAPPHTCRYLKATSVLRSNRSALLCSSFTFLSSEITPWTSARKARSSGGPSTTKNSALLRVCACLQAACQTDPGALTEVGGLGERAADGAENLHRGATDCKGHGQAGDYRSRFRNPMIEYGLQALTCALQSRSSHLALPHVLQGSRGTAGVASAHSRGVRQRLILSRALGRSTLHVLSLVLHSGTGTTTVSTGAS